MDKNNINAIHYKTGLPVSVELRDGHIASISESSQKTDVFIAPGLVDLQVNGYKGIDLNFSGSTSADVELLTKAIVKEGITTYCPTIITGDNSKIEMLLQVITRAMGNTVESCIGGIHLEGPFISPEDGPRGAHPKEHVKAPDWDLFCKWQKMAQGNIQIITMSPEWPNSAEFIKKCSNSGVIVSIGHTAASPQQIRQAIEAGATMSTHLGNATHLMLPRHPNYLWEQLASDHLWTSIIADGFHLPDAVLKVFLKVKPEKSILVSDATSFTGFPPGNYTSPIGGKVHLDAKGRLSMMDNPKLLAGSAQSLLWCINHLINAKLTMLSQAWDMASVRPAELLYGKQVNGLQVGKRADLVLFKVNEDKIEIVKTIKAGKTLFDSP